MSPSTRLPLFCFGSLMDSEVLELVSGCQIGQLQIIDAVAHDRCQQELLTESFPILRPAPGACATGRLVYGLTDRAMDRILFFEGDGYELDTLQVEAAGSAVDASWFRDTGRYQDTGREWSFDRWREQDRVVFLGMARQYMALYGSMSTTEANTVWQS